MPAKTFQEEYLTDLYSQIEAIREAPGCDQCTFKAAQIAELTAEGISPFNLKARKKYKEYKGYLKQTRHMAQACKSKLGQPSCWYCDVLGDTIIALQAPKDAAILTGDFQSFPALGELLDKPVEYIPTLKKLMEAKDNAKKK
jgi:hypothetical protein